jgi:preprotein translocase subunit YajC
LEEKVLETNLYAMAPSAPGADAAAAGASAPNPLIQFAPLLLIVVVFYFLMWRPQQKQAKARKAMLEALKSGDEVVTSGGMLGTLQKVEEDRVVVRIAEGVNVRMLRSAVEAVPKKKDDDPKA